MREKCIKEFHCRRKSTLFRSVNAMYAVNEVNSWELVHHHQHPPLHHHLSLFKVSNPHTVRHMDESMMICFYMKIYDLKALHIWFKRWNITSSKKINIGFTLNCTIYIGGWTYLIIALTVSLTALLTIWMRKLQIIFDAHDADTFPTSWCIM